MEKKAEESRNAKQTTQLVCGISVTYGTFMHRVAVEPDPKPTDSGISQSTPSFAKKKERIRVNNQKESEKRRGG